MVLNVGRTLSETAGLGAAGCEGAADLGGVAGFVGAAFPTGFCIGFSCAGTAAADGETPDVSEVAGTGCDGLAAGDGEG